MILLETLVRILGLVGCHLGNAASSVLSSHPPIVLWVGNCQTFVFLRVSKDGK